MIQRIQKNLSLWGHGQTVFLNLYIDDYAELDNKGSCYTYDKYMFMIAMVQVFHEVGDEMFYPTRHRMKITVLSSIA